MLLCAYLGFSVVLPPHQVTAPLLMGMHAYNLKSQTWRRLEQRGSLGPGPISNHHAFGLAGLTALRSGVNVSASSRNSLRALLLCLGRISGEATTRLLGTTAADGGADGAIGWLLYRLLAGYGEGRLLVLRQTDRLQDRPPQHLLMVYDMSTAQWSVESTTWTAPNGLGDDWFHVGLVPSSAFAGHPMLPRYSHRLLVHGRLSKPGVTDIQDRCTQRSLDSQDFRVFSATLDGEWPPGVRVSTA